MTTAERVLQLLKDEGGYKELPKPLKIGTLSFDFTHALVAGPKAIDLVIIIELKGDTDDQVVVRKILSLTRVLDVLRSRRSVTVVFTSGQATATTINAINRVCRVLPVGSPTGPNAETEIRDWLSVLLPLQLATTIDAKFEWEADVRATLTKQGTAKFVDAVIHAATQGASEVQQVLQVEVERLTRTALEDDQGTDQ